MDTQKLLKKRDKKERKKAAKAEPTSDASDNEEKTAVAPQIEQSTPATAAESKSESNTHQQL